MIQCQLSLTFVRTIRPWIRVIDRLYENELSFLECYTAKTIDITKTYAGRHIIAPHWPRIRKTKEKRALYVRVIGPRSKPTAICYYFIINLVTFVCFLLPSTLCSLNSAFINYLLNHIKFINRNRIMKSVLITGCNRGLGLGLIRNLVRGVDNSPTNLIATCRDIGKAKVRYYHDINIILLTNWSHYLSCIY